MSSAFVSDDENLIHSGLKNIVRRVLQTIPILGKIKMGKNQLSGHPGFGAGPVRGSQKVKRVALRILAHQITQLMAQVPPRLFKVPGHWAENPQVDFQALS